jgi:hypothetical protein
MGRPNVVKNAPSLLHAVALVGSTHAATVRNIRNMERGFPPALYQPSVDLICGSIKRIAEGTAKADAYTWARAQAETQTDQAVRDCTKEVLAYLRPYILNVRPKWFRPIDVEYFQVGAELQIPVKVTGLMGTEEGPVILMLHLWRKPLEIEQRGAGAAILKNRLDLREELIGTMLHFVDISVPVGKNQREYGQLSWEQVSPLSDEERRKFTDRLYKAWLECQANPEPQKPYNPRPDSRQRDMFSLDPSD